MSQPLGWEDYFFNKQSNTTFYYKITHSNYINLNLIKWTFADHTQLNKDNSLWLILIQNMEHLEKHREKKVKNYTLIPMAKDSDIIHWCININMFNLLFTYIFLHNLNHIKVHNFCNLLFSLIFNEYFPMSLSILQHNFQWLLVCPHIDKQIDLSNLLGSNI